MELLPQERKARVDKQTVALTRTVTAPLILVSGGRGKPHMCVAHYGEDKERRVVRSLCSLPVSPGGRSLRRRLVR